MSNFYSIEYHTKKLSILVQDFSIEYDISSDKNQCGYHCSFLSINNVKTNFLVRLDFLDFSLSSLNHSLHPPIAYVTVQLMCRNYDHFCIVVALTNHSIFYLKKQIH